MAARLFGAFLGFTPDIGTLPSPVCPLCRLPRALTCEHFQTRGHGTVYLLSLQLFNLRNDRSFHLEVHGSKNFVKAESDVVQPFFGLNVGHIQLFSPPEDVLHPHGPICGRPGPRGHATLLSLQLLNLTNDRSFHLEIQGTKKFEKAESYVMQRCFA